MFQHAALVCNQEAILSQYQPAQKKVPKLTHGWGADERFIVPSVMGKPEEREPVGMSLLGPPLPGQAPGATGTEVRAEQGASMGACTMFT